MIDFVKSGSVHGKRYGAGPGHRPHARLRRPAHRRADQGHRRIRAEPVMTCTCWPSAGSPSSAASSSSIIAVVVLMRQHLPHPRHQPRGAPRLPRRLRRAGRLAVPDGRDLVVYGIGLQGPERDVEAGRRAHRAAGPTRSVDGGVLDRPPMVADGDADPTDDCGGRGRPVRRARAGRSSTRVTGVPAGAVPPPRVCSRSEAFAAGEFQVVDVFDKGGERYPQLFDGTLDFLAFCHTPHYVVVEVAPLVPQRTEPGRAPAAARDRHESRSASTCT